MKLLYLPLLVLALWALWFGALILGPYLWLLAVVVFIGYNVIQTAREEEAREYEDG